MGGHGRGWTATSPDDRSRYSIQSDREGSRWRNRLGQEAIHPIAVSYRRLYFAPCCPLTREGKDVQERICFASSDSHWCGRLCDHGLRSTAGSRGGAGEIPTLEYIRSKLPATRDRQLQESDPRHAGAAGHRSTQLVPLRADPCT